MKYLIVATMFVLFVYVQQPVPVQQGDPYPPTLPPIITPLPGTPPPDRGTPPTMPPLSTDISGTPLPDPGDPPVRPLHSKLYISIIYS